MKVKFHSYRFAQEILQHENHIPAWEELISVCESSPLFRWPNKSTSNKKLDVVQQLQNVYFDRRLAIDLGWEHHPLATDIEDSNLRADFKKQFGKLAIQVEVQFGNMARWYSDIFKFQTAYSQGLIQGAISIVPTSSLGRRIDSNIAHYERALRELPSAELSITLPILLIGMEPDSKTHEIDVSTSKFDAVGEITKKGNAENLWRVVNGTLEGASISDIGPDSVVGPQIEISS